MPDEPSHEPFTPVLPVVRERRRETQVEITSLTYLARSRAMTGGEPAGPLPAVPAAYDAMTSGSALRPAIARPVVRPPGHRTPSRAGRTAGLVAATVLVTAAVTVPAAGLLERRTDTAAQPPGVGAAGIAAPARSLPASPSTTAPQRRPGLPAPATLVITKTVTGPVPRPTTTTSPTPTSPTTTQPPPTSPPPTGTFTAPEPGQIITERHVIARGEVDDVPSDQTLFCIVRDGNGDYWPHVVTRGRGTSWFATVGTGGPRVDGELPFTLVLAAVTETARLRFRVEYDGTHGVGPSLPPGVTRIAEVQIARRPASPSPTTGTRSPPAQG
jgi:hypothetical protein